MARVIQVGNFEPEHSTENHLLRALRNNGHQVRPMQENDPATFQTLAHHSDMAETDVVLWTRTGWDWDRIYPGGERMALAHQQLMLRRGRAIGTPVVGYHLDIWWDLPRAIQVVTEPFFHCELLITADGGHDANWVEAGVNHVWFPPAISEGEAKTGNRRQAFVSPLAFVGSWQGGYHPESAHRAQLVAWLQRHYPQCAFYPRPGEHAIRGKPLQDLYRSVAVVVGDSCFTGTGLANYWSDRIPETLGRGGVLIHPDVPGLDKFFTDGLDLMLWNAGDFDALGALIESVLANPIQRDELRRQGQRTVLAGHTYEHRMTELFNLLEERNML